MSSITKNHCAWKPNRDAAEQVRLPTHVKQCGGVAVARNDFEGTVLCQRHYLEARAALETLRDLG